MNQTHGPLGPTSQGWTHYSRVCFEVVMRQQLVSVMILNSAHSGQPACGQALSPRVRRLHGPGVQRSGAACGFGGPAPCAHQSSGSQPAQRNHARPPLELRVARLGKLEKARGNRKGVRYGVEKRRYVRHSQDQGVSFSAGCLHPR